MCLTARGYEWPFRSIDSSDGLRHNSVFCISQDRYGFMWFGTRFGLSRFDGSTFRVWDNSNSSLTNNAVRDLCVASDSIVFVATENGVHRLNILDGKMSVLPVCKGEFFPRSLKLALDADNVLWVASLDMGVFSYSEGGCRHYDELSSATSIISSGDFIFACSPENGLFRLNKQSGSFAKVLDSSYLPLSLYEVEKDLILVGTQGLGLVELRYPTTADPPSRLVPTGAEQNVNIVRDILSRDDDILLATEGGLVVYHVRTGEMEHHVYEPQNSSSIADNALYSLYSDSDGGLWIGSYFRGLSYLSAVRSKFGSYSVDDSGEYSCGYAVSSFFELSDGEILVASEDAGLSTFDSATGILRPFKDQSKLSYNNIHDVCRDEKGRLWIGTYLHGIDVYNPATRRVEFNINEQQGRIHSNSVYRIYPDSRGKIHIGTTSGASVCDPSDGSVTRLEITRSGIIRDILEDSKGNIWYISMNRGIFRYSPITDRWTEYSLRNGSLPTDKTVCVRQSEDGRVWVGTEGYGLLCYDYITNSFSNNAARGAAPCRFVFSIEASGEILWIGTTTGLYRYNTQTEDLRRYDEGDGIRAPYFNYNASRTLSDGSVCFGTVKGFFHFFPSAVQTNPASPQAYITSFTAKNRSREVSFKTERLSDLNFHSSSPLQLAYNDNSIEVRFTSVSFSQPRKNTFKYFLEGFESGYCEPTSSRIKEYNNLSPGSYVFHLISANEDGVWSEMPTSFAFQVRRPWWLSGWAALCYILAASFFTWLMYRRWRIRRQREEEKKLQQINESKISFFTNITHEIKTPLTLLRSPLELIRREGNVSEAVSSQLDVIERNLDWLSQLVEELLKFRQLESQEYQLKVSRLDIRNELQRILSQFRSYSSANGIRLEFIDNLQAPLEVELDAYALTKVISNLLLNSFKYTRDQVALVLRYHPGDRDFFIYIMDNGSGVEKSEVEEIFKPFVQLDSSKKYHGVGIGLALVKTLVELHDGRLDIISHKGRYFVAKIQLPVHSALSVVEETVSPVDLEAARQCESILSVESSQLHLRRFGEEYSDRGNILVVEDNVEIGRVLIDYFNDRYCIGYSHNGDDALLYVAQYHPDIVITDIMMEGMDGVELCSRIKGDAAMSHTFVVMLTAKTDSSDRETGLGAGADAYICKPFSFTELEKALENMLSQKRKMLDLASKGGGGVVGLPILPGQELSVQDREFLRTMTTILKDNIDNATFSLGELATLMGKSRTLVYTKSMKLIGKSPVECLMMLRMETAYAKIEAGEGNVSQVAYSVGYSDPGYFSRAFKKYFGKTPTEIKPKR